MLLYLHQKPFYVVRASLPDTESFFTALGGFLCAAFFVINRPRLHRGDCAPVDLCCVVFALIFLVYRLGAKCRLDLCSSMIPKSCRILYSVPQESRGT